MNDIRPPKQRPVATEPQQEQPRLPPLPQVESTGTSSPEQLPAPKKTAVWRKVLLIVAGVVVAALLAVITWYYYQLQPVAANKSENTRVQITIPAGTGPDAIADLLAEKKLVRSATVFALYTRLHGIDGQLQAGQFSLSPSESTPEIVEHLRAGSADQFPVTFYPGATLNFAASGSDQTPSHRQVFEDLGYSTEEIDAAFSADYNHPLLQDKPAEASLEGYIYGQTYQIAAGSTVQQVIERTFDEYYKQLIDNELIAGFKSQGLNLYEAITLASIIQREVSGIEDQRQVAQIFYKRLAENMQLGADATFVYAAKKEEAAPSVDLDSPYNTRRYSGLPPGPIASPGLTALQATANPAPGDFLYFVSGDDGTNYFSKTLEEHEENTRMYCIENCSLF